MSLSKRKGAYFFIIAIICFFQSVFAKIPDEFRNFPWRTGDVIGVSELFYDWSTFFFEAATGSRFGHVGIVSVETSGIFVYEENDPYAQKTALDTFLERAGKDPITKMTLATIIRPKRALSNIEIKKLLWTANWATEKKIPYNHSQMMNKESLNCSEFVRMAFKNAGREVGQVERLGDLNINAFSGLLLKAWEYDAGKINPNNLVVSPMSVMSSPEFYPIYTHLPMYYLADRQIYMMWKSEGFIEELSKQTSIPEFVLNFIGSRSATTPWRK